MTTDLCHTESGTAQNCALEAGVAFRDSGKSIIRCDFMGQAFLQSPGLAATFKAGHTLDGIKPDAGAQFAAYDGDGGCVRGWMGTGKGA